MKARHRRLIAAHNRRATAAVDAMMIGLPMVKRYSYHAARLTTVWRKVRHQRTDAMVRASERRLDRPDGWRKP